MLRDCKKCSAIGFAVCACVVAGKAVRATEAEPVERGRFAVKMDDHPHTENEINAPQPTGLIGVRPSHTATINMLAAPIWITPGWPPQS